MRRHGVRLLVAILTFACGVAVVWPLQLIQRFESALVDRFYGNDLSPISLDDPAADANEIYRLLIHQKFTFSGKVRLIVLWSETTSSHPVWNDSRDYPLEFQERMKELMPEVQPQTIDDYRRRNQTPERLKLSTLGIDYVLVTDSDLPAASRVDFWNAFSQKYPNSCGLVFLSNIGFNDQHDQALVYVPRNCGLRCGGGDYILLRKVNGK